MAPKWWPPCYLKPHHLAGRCLTGLSETSAWGFRTTRVAARDCL